MSTTISGTNGVTFPDSTSMQTGQQACKAWVNFNGTGTVAIREQYNVSNITDNGTGDYTVNFTTAMPDANYSAVYGSQYSTTTIAGMVCETTGTTRTVSSLQIRTSNSAGATATDLPQVQVAIFSN